MGNKPLSQSPSAAEPSASALPNADGGREPAFVDSTRLFAGRTEIRLRHRGEEYRLRITRQGKLILTK